MEEDLHIFFFPLLAHGHMIPMLDLALLFSFRPGVRSTIVTTPGNVPSLQSALGPSPPPNLTILTIPFPSSVPGLPAGVENLSDLPTAEAPPPFLSALNLLETPFRALVADHRPDCIISDTFYAWTAGLGVPRFCFEGMPSFALVLSGTLIHLKPHDAVASDGEPFVVPGIPHEIKLTRSQLPSFVLRPEGGTAGITSSYGESLGEIVNSFRALEPEYVDYLKNVWGLRAWHVGPLSLRPRGVGRAEANDDHACLRWLDKQCAGSVLYVSFGTVGYFSTGQLLAMAAGIGAAGYPFIWVVRKAGDEMEWPVWFNAYVEKSGKCLIITGWAPQRLILNHPAVGGFMTHCGWNSTLEALSAGVPMITWPLFAEQFFNERLIVDVLKVGVEVGNKVLSVSADDRVVVGAESIRKAAVELMGDGKEANARREKAKELAEKAKEAVEDGGSSYNDITSMIDELIQLKKGSKGND